MSGSKKITDFNIYQLLSVAACFIYIVISFFGTSGPDWRVTGERIDVTEGNPLNQLALSVVFFLSFISLIPHYKKFFAWINREKYILFFLFWCGITMLWSVDPFIAFKRYFQYITTSFVFISFLLNWGNEESLIKILKIVLGLFLIISLGAVLTTSLAADPASGTWRGLHRSKNNLGQTAGLNVIFFAFLFFAEQKPFVKPIYLFLLIIALTLLFGANSMTAIIIIVLIAFYFIIQSPNKIFNSIGAGKFIGLMLVAFPIIIIVTLLLLSPDTIERFSYEIGKDPTLTGRTDIWYLLLSSQAGELITGAGYQTFWLPANLAKLPEFGIWMPTNQGHNGYVDIVLEVGIIGLSLFIILLFDIAKNKFKKDNTLWLLFIIFALLTNISESTLLRPNHYTNVFFFMSFWVMSFKNFISQDETTH